MPRKTGDRWTRNLSEKDKRGIEDRKEGFEKYREKLGLPCTKRNYDDGMRYFVDYIRRAMDDTWFIFKNWLKLPVKEQERWFGLMFNDQERCRNLLLVMLGANKGNFRLQMDFIEILQKVMDKEMKGYTLTFSVQPSGRKVHGRLEREIKKFYERQPIVLYDGSQKNE